MASVLVQPILTEFCGDPAYLSTYALLDKMRDREYVSVMEHFVENELKYEHFIEQATNQRKQIAKNLIRNAMEKTKEICDATIKVMNNHHQQQMQALQEENHRLRALLTKSTSRCSHENCSEDSESTESSEFSEPISEQDESIEIKIENQQMDPSPTTDDYNAHIIKIEGERDNEVPPSILDLPSLSPFVAEAAERDENAHDNTSDNVLNSWNWNRFVGPSQYHPISINTNTSSPSATSNRTTKRRRSEIKLSD